MNNLKKVIENLMKVFAILFALFFFVVLLNTIFFNRTTHINYSVSKMLILPIISYIFLFIIYKIYKKHMIKIQTKDLQKKNWIIYLIFMAIVLILQIVFAKFTYAKCGWDCGIVMESGYNLAMENKIETEYFARCPNNIGMLLIVKYIVQFLKLFGFVTLESAYFYMIVFNIIIVDISAILTFKTCKQIYNSSYKYISLLFIIPLITFIPYIIIPYTDTISMVFPILIFYNYITIKKEENNTKKNILIFLEGFLTIIGYYIKPTIIIVIIAICIMELLRYKNSNIKNIAKTVGMFILGCVVSYIIYLGIVEINLGQLISKEDYEKNAMPMTHFMKMGLKETESNTDLPVKNTIMYGSFNGQDVESTVSNVGKEEKIQENLETVKQRLKDYGKLGYIKFLYNKCNWILSDGTFFFGQEGGFWPEGNYMNTKEAIYIQEFLNNRSLKFINITANIFQTLWILIFIGLACSYINKQEDNTILVAKLTIIGIIMFLLLFEGRSRYVVNHMPFFITVGIYGLKNSFDILMNLFNKVSIHKLYNSKR